MLRMIQLCAAGVLAGLIAFVVVQAVAAQLGGPLRPPWIRADGTTNYSLMPDCIPIVGANGSRSVDSTGQPRCYLKSDLQRLPPNPSSPEAEDDTGTAIPGERVPVPLTRP